MHEYQRSTNKSQNENRPYPFHLNGVCNHRHVVIYMTSQLDLHQVTCRERLLLGQPIDISRLNAVMGVCSR